jgi:hypothetical protein
VSGAYPDGTGGWSGADTSRDRAEHERDSGKLSQRLVLILHALDIAGARGATWKELADLTGWHHGRVSSALTNLHKQGLVFTLKTRRSHCHPYVHSAWLHDWSPGAVNLRPGTTRRNHLIEPLEAVAAAAEELLNEIEVSRGAWIINDDRIETLHNALNNLTTARNTK